jgi:hypothetical protein
LKDYSSLTGTGNRFDSNGTSIKLVGKGLITGQVHEPILNADQVGTLVATPEKATSNGDRQASYWGSMAEWLTPKTLAPPLNPRMLAVKKSQRIT